MSFKKEKMWLVSQGLTGGDEGGEGLLPTVIKYQINSTKPRKFSLAQKPPSPKCSTNWCFSFHRLGFL